MPTINDKSLSARDYKELLEPLLEQFVTEIEMGAHCAYPLPDYPLDFCDYMIAFNDWCEIRGYPRFSGCLTTTL